jgi:hypothetical protein
MLYHTVQYKILLDASLIRLSDAFGGRFAIAQQHFSEKVMFGSVIASTHIRLR